MSTFPPEEYDGIDGRVFNASYLRRSKGANSPCNLGTLLHLAVAWYYDCMDYSYYQMMTALRAARLYVQYGAKALRKKELDALFRPLVGFPHRNALLDEHLREIYRVYQEKFQQPRKEKGPKDVSGS